MYLVCIFDYLLVVSKAWFTTLSVFQWF